MSAPTNTVYVPLTPSQIASLLSLTIVSHTHSHTHMYIHTESCAHTCAHTCTRTNACMCAQRWRACIAKHCLPQRSPAFLFRVNVFVSLCSIMYLHVSCMHYPAYFSMSLGSCVYWLSCFCMKSFKTVSSTFGIFRIVFTSTE